MCAIVCVEYDAWVCVCAVGLLLCFFVERFKMFSPRFCKHSPRIEQAKLGQRVLCWILGILPLQVNKDTTLCGAFGMKENKHINIERMSV